MIEDLLDATVALMSSPWVYLLIAFVAMVDALIPVAPSETVVITAGVFAASGSTNVLLVVAGAALGAMAGDHGSYLIGRLMGRWTDGQDLTGWRARAVGRATSLLAERGGMALLVARYIPGGRTAVTLGMGVLRHPLTSFSRWDAVAALTWAVYCSAIGLIGGSAFADDPLPAVLLGMTLALAVAGIAELLRHTRRGRQGASARGNRPATRTADPVCPSPSSI